MAEPYIVKMPQLSDTMTEGVIVSWEKAVGDKVSRGDIVATVETDKAVMDVEVFREGYLSGPLAPIDIAVPVGAPIAYLVEQVDQAQTRNVDTGKQPIHVAPTESASLDVSHDGQDGLDTPLGTIYVIKMPQLSDTMTEGVIVSWEKAVGDKVSRGDIVATVETDKAVMDVEVFREGYLSGPQAAVDTLVPVGGVLAYLVEKAEQVATGRRVELDTVSFQKASATALPEPKRDHASAESIMSRPRNKQASPYARKLAGELHIDLDRIPGTGPSGTIVGEDVLRTPPAPSPRTMRGPTPANVRPEIHVPGEGRPMNAMEKAISHSMTASLAMPTFHVTVHIKTNRLIKLAKRKGISVTVAVAKACTEALKQHPRLNWAYQPIDRLVERHTIDLGMAVAVEGGGLVVPILRDCASKSLETLNDVWAKLVERARKRRLTPEEYAHPTFVISNLGMLSVDHFDAIPTPGTAAILAISSISDRGTPFTITADHRVINGAEVAMFLNTLKHRIEHPDEWAAPLGTTIPEGKWDYDVVILGGGPGGEDCARELAEHGLKVAMVNDAPLPGGECLWRGCIPSKTWRAAADRIRDRAHDMHLGVENTTAPRINWNKLDTTRRKILETRGEMALKTDIGVKVKVVQGYAHFESDHRVFVDTSGNNKERYARAIPGDRSQGEYFTFGCAVIATGAPPFIPPIAGANEGVKTGGVLTSDTVWNLNEVPKTLAIIGAGAIGIEMAQIFQDLGTEVLLVEARDRILVEVESEIAKGLAAVLNRDPHLTVHVSAKVTEIKGKPGSMTLVFEDSNGEVQRTECDYILMATGKRPILEPLQLDKLGVTVENGTIKTDACCRTSLSHIFAVGDVTGGYMLAHTAGAQGRVAAATILGEEIRYDQDKDCGVIFTRPQAAFVGLSLEQAKAKNIDAIEVKIPMSIDAKAMITDENQGMIKMVVDRTDQRILGIHFLADHADTLIGEAVMMVTGNMTLSQVAHAIHPHPTQTELFGDMARRLLSRLRRSTKIKEK